MPTFDEINRSEAIDELLAARAKLLAFKQNTIYITISDGDVYAASAVDHNGNHVTGPHRGSSSDEALGYLMREYWLAQPDGVPISVVINYLAKTS